MTYQRKINIAWNDIFNDYISSKLNLEQIADKHGVSPSTLRKRAWREGWTKLKKNVKNIMEQKMEHIIEQKMEQKLHQKAEQITDETVNGKEETIRKKAKGVKEDFQRENMYKELLDNYFEIYQDYFTQGLYNVPVLGSKDETIVPNVKELSTIADTLIKVRKGQEGKSENKVCFNIIYNLTSSSALTDRDSD
jgi:transposase-like protein